MEYKVVIAQHPEIGRGWWWEVTKLRESGHYGLVDSGFCFTLFMAKFAVKRNLRLAKRADKSPGRVIEYTV